MCQRCQLTEEQRFELVNSVRLVFGLGGTPSKSFPNPPTAPPQEIVCVQATLLTSTMVTTNEDRDHIREYLGPTAKEASVPVSAVVDASTASEDATWAVVDSNPQLQSEAIWQDGSTVIAPTITTSIEKSDLEVKSLEGKQDAGTSNENLPVNSLVEPLPSKGKAAEEKSQGLLSFFSFSSLTSSKPKSSSKSKLSSSSTTTTTTTSTISAPVTSTAPSEPSPPSTASLSPTGESNSLILPSSTTNTTNKAVEEDLYAVL